MGQPKAKKARSRSKIKKYKRNVWLCNRDKDIDQIQDEIQLQQQTGIPIVQRILTGNDPILLLQQQQATKEVDDDGSGMTTTTTTPQQPAPLPTTQLYDDELPGGGLFYCVETAKHFISAEALANHKKTKFYKRRVKEIQLQNHHTHTTADWASGKTKERLPPIHNNNKKHPEMMN